MNYLFILWVWLLSFIQPNIQPQHFVHTHALDTVKTVAAIKTTFGAYEAKRKTFSQYMPLKMEKGELYVGYYEGTSLRMITANFYGDTGKIEADEYMDATGVVLIYAKVSDYETSISVNPRTKIKLMTENWYYFKNENLIKWVSGGKVVPAGSLAFKEKSAKMKLDIAKHKKMFSDMSLLNKIK